VICLIAFSAVRLLSRVEVVISETLNIPTINHRCSLNPVHTSNSVEATLSNATRSNVASTLLPKMATMSKQQATKLRRCRCNWPTLLHVASTMLLVWTGHYSLMCVIVAVFWCSGNGVGRINEVTQRRAGLYLAATRANSASYPRRDGK